jgi:hypothetical protein
MYTSFTSLRQVTLSAVAALFVAAIAVSAAVPVMPVA